MKIRNLLGIGIGVACLGMLAGCVGPSPVESHFNRGVALYDEGKLADSIDEYKLALRQDPNDTFAKYNLAVAYQDQKKFDGALGLYQEVLQQTEDTNSRINMAAIHYTQGSKETAFETLRLAMDANPDNPNPSSILGEYMERMDKLAEARGYYEKALAIDPQHAVSHFRLGRLYIKQSRPHLGETHILKAIEIDKEVPIFYETLAEDYMRTGKTSQAIDMLERVSVLQPDRQEVFAKLGDLYAQDQHFEHAVNRYWTAIAIKDNDPQVHVNLKKIFKHLEMRETEALKSFRERGTVASNKK